MVFNLGFSVYILLCNDGPESRVPKTSRHQQKPQYKNNRGTEFFITKQMWTSRVPLNDRYLRNIEAITDSIFGNYGTFVVSKEKNLPYIDFIGRLSKDQYKYMCIT